MRFEDIRLLAVPRDQNPYQDLLYGELARLGARVRYAGELTPSRTLNLLLLPLELTWRRIGGWRVLHLHWVFGFALPLRRLAQGWFAANLTLARLLGMRVVWTAHNALPHERVFHDDAAARRALVRASDLVFAHSPAALAELRRIGAEPRRAAVVPHPPPDADADTRGLRRPGEGGRGRHLLFVGRVLEYKGVEELVEAVAALPPEVELRLTVAGECPDAALRERLERLASERVELRLERVPDGAMTKLIASADAVVLPFRRVTTSGSATQAMHHARPVVLPDLPAFSDLPADALIRYDGSRAGLAAALERVAGYPADELAAIGERARAHVSAFGWPDLALRTAEELTA